jgi:hypothetical protein
VELKHFTKEDWAFFAGCESETPFIGYSATTTMVVDGKHVELYDGTMSFPRWQLEFPDHGMAMMFALESRGGEPDHIVRLRAAKYSGETV